MITTFKNINRGKALYVEVFLRLSKLQFNIHFFFFFFGNNEMKGEVMSLKPIECLYNLAINLKKKKKKVYHIIQIVLSI